MDMDDADTIQKPELPIVLADSIEGNEIHFDTDGDGANDAYWKVDNEGNIVGGVTSDNKNLAFDANGKGTQRWQYELANEHKEWTPDQVAKAAHIASVAGLDPTNPENVEDIELPPEPKVLGEAVRDIEVDADGDGKTDSVWHVDKDGNKVGGRLMNGKELFFDPNSDGTPGLQHEIANNTDLNPDQVAISSYRAFLDGVSPDDTEALNNLPEPELPIQEEIPNIDNLDKAQGFDNDYDGKTDSWWLADRETGEVKAGLLQDGRMLYLGEEGGTTGVVQEYVYENNSNISPDQNAVISTRAVENNELGPPEVTHTNFENVITPKQAEIINSVNTDIARFSLEKYIQVFGVNTNQSHEIAWNRVGVNIKDIESIYSEELGPEALSQLDAKVTIDGEVKTWRTVPWLDWLRNNGYIE
jgi:hypothetical protein